MKMMKRTKELLEQSDEHERAKDKRGAAMIQLSPAQKNYVTASAVPQEGRPHSGGLPATGFDERLYQSLRAGAR